MCQIRYKRDQLLDLIRGSRNHTLPNKETLTVLKVFYIFKYRGARGGRDQENIVWDTIRGVNLDNLKSLPKIIPTVTSIKRINIQSQTERTSFVTSIKCESLTVVKGNTKIDICCINPRSVKNKTVSLCDFILPNNFDLIAITETWLSSSINKACLSELLPNGYQIKHVPLPGNKS